jgi:LacI family transcriptional regulator
MSDPDEPQRMTIDKVAELAYVSRSVVSRVLNDRANVSDEARQRVLNVMEEHNYRPSAAARSLANDRTFEIGVLTPLRGGDAFGNSFWPLLHSGIFDQCMERGYFVSLSMVAPDRETDIKEHFLSNKRFDGFIFVTQRITELMADVAEAHDVPFTLVGRAPKHAGWHSVDVDNAEGARLAVRHLHGLGHERIAALLGRLEMRESTDRRDGYRRGLREAGLSPERQRTATGDYSGESGFEVMQRWLEEGLGATAVFCASDTMATGAMLALHQAGVSVPDEMAVVGFDNLPLARYTTPPLTTVHQPIREKGRRAAGLLLDQIEEKDSEQRHATLETELIVRASCGASA